MIRMERTPEVPALVALGLTQNEARCYLGLIGRERRWGTRVGRWALPELGALRRTATSASTCSSGTTSYVAERASSASRLSVIPPGC